ncbi:MAG: hypothetical protein WCH39_00530 [Schlesneria sp.]
MKVLVACEYSGTVRDAFLSRGHDAMSCDLLPTDVPGPHYQGGVFDVIGDGWDLMIAHPPCTYLSVSGMHWTTRGLRDPQLTDDALEFVRRLLDAPIERIALENPVSVISTRIRKPDQIVHPWMFGEDASKKTCLWLKGLKKLEPYYPNCVPPNGWNRVMSFADMLQCEDCEEPFCAVHQMHYADCDCIGPTETDVVYKTTDGFMFATRQDPAPNMRWGNQTGSGQNKLGPSDDRWKIRSKTYDGIARAMAEQWG